MKKFFCVSLVAALSLLLFSCSNFFSSSSSDNESAPNGKARVHFSVGKTDARTIMPESYTGEDIKLIELTAQKKGEETAYKFNGEKEKLSWNSLSELEKASIDIDYGTYTFVLNLSIKDKDEENKTVLVQTCTLENQEINADTKELVFNMQEDSGDVSIAVSWELRDETNRIGKIGVGLYTIASNGETTIGISDAEKTLTIKGADTSVTATGSYASVPSGSYLIKLSLYDSESSTTPFNTITDIIKVNGYKTNYDLHLEFANLNLQYNVTFNPNGGLWEGGSEDSITTTRNMYSGFIPPKEVSKDDFVLVGWYFFEDGEPSEDLSQGISSDAIMIGPEMGARDYTFYAIWGKQAGGNLSTDNRALIIKTDIVDGKIYQNSKINLSVTDSAGESVTDSITYAAKILYKGQDINELGGKTYYSVVETQGVITLNGKTTPLPEANYQLYVTASRELSSGASPVTSSQTFNVKLLDGIETQVALYNYDSNTSTYNYYLTDSANVKTAALDGTADFTSSKDNFVFDAAGNIYNLNDDKKLVSNNELFKNQQLDLSDALSVEYGKSSKGVGFTIDVTTNTAYGYVIESESDTYTLKVYKYPKLISDCSLEEKTSLSLSNISLKGGYKVSINNNLLYLYGTADYTNYKVIVYDISSGSMVQFSEFNVTEYLTASERGFASTTDTDNISVNDIFATEGALYLLVQEKIDVKSTSKDIYRRGSVIKYIPPETSNGTGTTRFLDLKTTPAISKTAISNMALYYDSATNGNASGPLYAVAGTNSVSPSGMEAVVTIENVGKTLAFPDIYGVNETEKYLSAPAKVIAVKPKKLVIADDGCAFYTDSECLKYKNMNRIVTVDLEGFVVESVQTTTAEFSSNISSYLKTDIAIDTLGEIKTSQENGYYFESSVKQWELATIAGIKNQVYLAVKPGE